MTLTPTARRQPGSAGSSLNNTENAQALLAEGGFDLVVLQDQSQTPGYDVTAVTQPDLDAAVADAEGDKPLRVPGSPAGYTGGNGALNRAESLGLLRSYYGPAIARGGARPVLYSTWGRQHGDEANPEHYPTFDAMLGTGSNRYGGFRGLT